MLYTLSMLTIRIWRSTSSVSDWLKKTTFSLICLKNYATISSDWFKMSSILNGCYSFVKSNGIQTEKKKQLFLFFYLSDATVMFFITITIILGNTRNPRPASKKFSKNSAKRQRESRTFYRYTKIPLILTVPGTSTDERHQVSSDLSVNMRTDHDLFKLTDGRQNHLFWHHSFNPSFKSSDTKFFWWIVPLRNMLVV